MYIYTAEQIRKWDAYTIENEPISSIDLMERAARECVDYIFEMYSMAESFGIFCGPGNNGGDGLAIARLLHQDGIPVTVYLLSSGIGSREYEINLKRFKKLKGRVVYLKEDFDFSKENFEIVIDAIFGIGLNKPAEGFYSRIIEFINELDAEVVSIDIPSGMFADKSSQGCSVIRANTTLTFEQKKRACYMQENGDMLGKVEVIPIGLLPEFVTAEEGRYWVIGKMDGVVMYKRRSPFAHKGDFGHACLIAGSHGMMGAAILSAHGCLRSGVGKLTVYTCADGYNIMQTSVPESMCKTSGENFITGVHDIDDVDVIGVGPGIGQHPGHAEWLSKIFELQKPMVIDADALNVLSQHKNLYGKIPKNSILTPHPKEFERLFGKTKNEFEQQELAIKMAIKYQIYIVLKSHYTMIATPHGKGYYNDSGNAGMATGGSGDVLTGVLTGLLAQNYDIETAASLGVYIHGLAGDLAASEWSENAMTASDIHQHIGKAYLELANPSRFLGFDDEDIIGDMDDFGYEWDDEFDDPDEGMDTNRF